MIKRLFIVWFLVLTTARVVAQNYGNEWINYSQKHYRISIPKTGLYRIDYTTLINAGIPLGSINPKNFQLFCKGCLTSFFFAFTMSNMLYTFRVSNCSCGKAV